MLWKKGSLDGGRRGERKKVVLLRFFWQGKTFVLFQIGGVLRFVIPAGVSVPAVCLPGPLLFGFSAVLGGEGRCSGALGWHCCAACTGAARPAVRFSVMADGGDLAQQQVGNSAFSWRKLSKHNRIMES